MLSPRRWAGLWKHWQTHAGTNVMMIVVMTLGLAVYIFFGGWQARVVPSLQSRSAPLLADAAIWYPDWVGYARMPSFDLAGILAGAGSQGTQSAVVGYRLPVETSAGDRHLLAMPLGAGGAAFWSRIDVARGQVPMGVGEALVRDGLKLSPGDSLQVIYREPFANDFHTRGFTVVGTFQSEDPTLTDVLVGRSDIDHLAPTMTPNALFIWFPADLSAFGFRSEVVTERLQAIKSNLPVTRLPSLPRPEAGVSRADTFGQENVIPYAFAVEPMVYSPYGGATVTSAIAAVAKQRVAAVYPLVASVFVLMAGAVTVLIVVQIVDRQRDGGIYLVTGYLPSEVALLFHRQVLVNVAAATLPGSLLGLAAGWFHGVPLPFNAAVGSLAIWCVFGLAVSIWSNHASRVLLATAQPTDLLAQRSSFDWWALVRF